MAKSAEPWFWRIRARFSRAAHSPVTREIAMTAAHALESRTVLSQDAEITAKLLQNLGPLLTSLQPTQDAVVRVGAVLVVKENWVVTIRQLTASQQLLLDHAPHLQTSPRETLRTLRLAEGVSPPPRRDRTHLELTGDPASKFPALPAPDQFRSARIVHCAYPTLVPLAAFTNLIHVEIVGYPDDTLEPIGQLTQLEELSIMHLPRVTDLSPLASLANLRRLDLMTWPGQGSSGNPAEVASLSPLCALPKLEELNLFGVRPPNQRVDDLLKCSALRVACVTGYPDLEVDRLSEALSTRD